MAHSSETWGELGVSWQCCFTHRTKSDDSFSALYHFLVPPSADEFSIFCHDS